MITRGTAPINTFSLPVDASLVSKVRVNYKQQDKLVIIKTEAHEDTVMEERALQVRLTQRETLDLQEGCSVLIQVDVLATDGTPYRSNIVHDYVGRCLNDEVLE